MSRTRKTPEQNTWYAMRGRCTNPRNRAFKYYGARGIKISPTWSTFHAFIRDVGHRPSSDHSIDRINNDGDYEPGNVRWSTRTQQNRNRSTTVSLTHNGATLTVQAWAERIGVSYDTLLGRLNRGMPTAAALSMQFREHNPETYALAKLDWTKVISIRARLAAGESRQGIALAFNVHHDTIRMIAHGKTWKESSTTRSVR